LLFPIFKEDPINKPIQVLIVSNDFTTSTNIRTQVKDQLGDRVSLVDIFRDYNFSIEGIDVLVGNGLCKTRLPFDPSIPVSIRFPEAKRMAKRKKIPYISFSKRELTPAKVEAMVKKIVKTVKEIEQRSAVTT
jgi:hypothetical protein